jgi:hypothetical protein
VKIDVHNHSNLSITGWEFDYLEFSRFLFHLQNGDRDDLLSKPTVCLRALGAVHQQFKLQVSA